MSKLYCVCAFCGKHSDDNTMVELNFRDKTIYYVCPHCKKDNISKIEFQAPPLPRIKKI